MVVRFIVTWCIVWLAMAERKRQYSTYTGEELGDQIEAAAEQYDMSVAELLREGARRQISVLEAEDND